VAAGALEPRAVVPQQAKHGAEEHGSRRADCVTRLHSVERGEFIDRMSAFRSVRDARRSQIL
jgi:hypothetical protein